MSNFAVLRFRKLTSAPQIAATGRHNRRRSKSPRDFNAAPVEVLCGSGDLLADCKALWPEKRRKNAVLAVEIVLSASPDFFRPGREGQAGQYDFARYEAFEALAWGWLNDRFPGMLVDCVGHLSETTPHIHAVLVPLLDGKLNARELFFGSPKKLSAWQSDWAKAARKIGLERGISSLLSGRKHRPLGPLAESELPPPILLPELSKSARPRA